MCMTIAQEVLNAACDDWENLEQIYRSIVFEFVSENYDASDASTYHWRDRQSGITLADIIGCISKFVETGMLDARAEDGEVLTSLSNENIAMIWFKSSKIGMEYLQSSL